MRSVAQSTAGLLNLRFPGPYHRSLIEVVNSAFQGTRQRLPRPASDYTIITGSNFVRSDNLNLRLPGTVLGVLYCIRWSTCFPPSSLRISSGDNTCRPVWDLIFDGEFINGEGSGPSDHASPTSRVPVILHSLALLEFEFAFSKTPSGSTCFLPTSTRT